MRFLRIVALFLLPLVAFATVTSTVDKSGPFLLTSLPQAIPTGFPFVSSSELLVLDTGTVASPRDPAAILTLGSDYTVSGGNYNGANQMQTGTVTVASGGAHSVLAGDYIVIMRNVPINQTSSFTSTGPLTVKLLEQMGDKLATLSQQVNEVTSRSLRFENFEFLDGTLSKESRAAHILGFDANGVPEFINPATFGTNSIVGTANEISVNYASGVYTIRLPDVLIDPGTSARFNGTLGSGLLTGWDSLEQAAYVDTAYNFYGAKNVVGSIPHQSNYFMFLGHDDNTSHANIVTLYAAMTDNHATASRDSTVGFEADVIHSGAGTTVGESGSIGYHLMLAGTVGVQLGTQGVAEVRGGTVTNQAGTYGFVTQSGGTVTNSYAGYFPGPSHTGGTVANNYGVFIGRVSNIGGTSNYQLYSETLNPSLAAGNPFYVDYLGNLSVPGTSGVGAAPLSNVGQRVAPSLSGNNNYGVLSLPTFTYSGNSQSNYSSSFGATSLVTGAFTGLTYIGISTSTPTFTGSGAGNAVQLYLAQAPAFSTAFGIYQAGNDPNQFGGGIVSVNPSAGIGYATGAGNVVTQTGSKAGTVILNAVTGRITMNNATLNASTSVSFTLTNSAITSTDLVTVCIASGATVASYFAQVDSVGTGTCTIHLRNVSGGNLSEAVVLRFAVIKSVNS